MERRTFLRFSTGAALSSALAACGGSGGGGSSTGHPPPAPSTPAPPSAPAARATVGWNNVVLAAIRATAMPAPVAARALAVVHTAIYNAWAAYDVLAVSTRHGATLRRPAAEHTLAYQVKALSFAAYAAVCDQFPSQRAACDAQMAQLGYNPVEASLDPTVPQGIGTLAATALLAWMHGDGANQLGTLTASGIPYADFTGYRPVNAALDISVPTARSAIAQPDRWQPLTFRDTAGNLRTQTYLAPFWGTVRPFALEHGAQFRPGPPAAFGTAAFDAQVREIITVQQALTDAQKVMVEYWAGGPTGELPGNYWSLFAQFVSQRDNHAEADDVKLFFALGNALLDAGIAAWDAKRAYDSARPITAVRYLLAGQTITGYGPDGPAAGLRTIPGEAWMPYQCPSGPTPPFPDHVSGHSTYSTASAEVLRRFTGSDAFNHGQTVAARSLLTDPAVPATEVRLSWSTFTDASCEAGLSRVYGGIHFSAADTQGRTLGAQVGGLAFDKARRYWLGQA